MKRPLRLTYLYILTIEISLSAHDELFPRIEQSIPAHEHHCRVGREWDQPHQATSAHDSMDAIPLQTLVPSFDQSAENRSTTQPEILSNANNLSHWQTSEGPVGVRQSNALPAMDATYSPLRASVNGFGGKHSASGHHLDAYAYHTQAIGPLQTVRQYSRQCSGTNIAAQFAKDFLSQVKKTHTSQSRFRGSGDQQRVVVKSLAEALVDISTFTGSYDSRSKLLIM